MPLSMSSAILPVCSTMLANLSHCLDKAQNSADARRFDPIVLTQSRLAPDMLPLSRQVLIACDAAKNGVARISGVEAPTFDDAETTLPELKARIRRTLDWLATVPAEKLDGTEEREVTFPAGRGVTRTLKAEAYLTHWMLPNFYSAWQSRLPPGCAGLRSNSWGRAQRRLPRCSGCRPTRSAPARVSPA